MEVTFKMGDGKRYRVSYNSKGTATGVAVEVFGAPSGSYRSIWRSPRTPKPRIKTILELASIQLAAARSVKRIGEHAGE